ncbi:hypothetical protein KY337_02770 [Candidatus Woesearchaeota archaeon]|nr:hypothetical protein [Candidatus Woesearchaeota archaeon]
MSNEFDDDVKNVIRAFAKSHARQELDRAKQFNPHEFDDYSGATREIWELKTPDGTSFYLQQKSIVSKNIRQLGTYDDAVAAIDGLVGKNIMEILRKGPEDSFRSPDSYNGMIFRVNMANHRHRIQEYTDVPAYRTCWLTEREHGSDFLRYDECDVPCFADAYLLLPVNGRKAIDIADFLAKQLGIRLTIDKLFRDELVGMAAIVNPYDLKTQTDEHIWMGIDEILRVPVLRQHPRESAN